MARYGAILGGGGGVKEKKGPPPPPPPRVLTRADVFEAYRLFRDDAIYKLKKPENDKMKSVFSAILSVFLLVGSLYFGSVAINLYSQFTADSSRLKSEHAK